MEAFGRFLTVQVTPLPIYGVLKSASGSHLVKLTNFAIFDPI